MIGVILAGGLSSRFDGEKALYELNHKAFFHLVYEAMHNSKLKQVVISTNKTLAPAIESYCRMHRIHMPIIIDDAQYTNKGPLAGIYSVMQYCQAEAYFIVSVDTPFITVDAIHHLMQYYEHNKMQNAPIDAVVYRDAQHVHRTIGIYKHTLKEKIKIALDQQQYALKVLTDARVQFVDVNEAEDGIWYENINTKNDLSRALKRR